MKTITKSVFQTKKIGQDLAKKIKDGGVVCLYGDLGAGKTAFVQGVAKGLGIENRINSPTFIIVRKYSNFWHIDLYRLKSKEEVRDLGLEEIMADQNNIVLIEWPEVALEILPKKRIDVKLKVIGENTREIVISMK